MKPVIVSTATLDLILQTPAETLAWVESLPPEVQKEVSPVWIDRVRSASVGDYWALGFNAFERSTGAPVGGCSFKGPPDADGAVEIAYGIDLPHQCRGFATEAANGLKEFAFGTGEVRVVRAHTKPENPASARVLTKCGFRQLGLVIDPEDGEVYRWESWPDGSGD